ncbi:lipid A core-O-antigen ligase [Klebsiella michiganensis]|uniref:Lipid A core-O-antigen ligase n=1 Tax=Klebsiella michiganensis TaxID=1134687 RepID=A0A7H4PEF1_9ENTR|nr:lipid A core-O-antigen ligase [Klebsiella michiganensis]
MADSIPPLSRRVPGLTYPHNDLLFWWVEGGAVALLGLLVLGVSGFWLLLRRPGVRQLALLACLMPILLHTQLEYPLYQSPVHWLFVLILVNLAGSLSVRRTDATARIHRALHAAGTLRR